MSIAKKVAHNSAIHIAGKGLSTFLGLIVVALITRYLGTEGYGNYITVITYLTFFGILADFGLVLVTTQMISEHKADEKRIINNLFTLRFFSALIFLGLAPMLVVFFPYSPLIKTGVALTALSFFFITLNQVLTGLFQKHLELKWVVLAENIGRVALLVGVIVAMTLNANLLAILVAVVAGSLLNFLTLFISARRFVRIRFTFESKIWKQIISRAWPIGISIAFNLIYLRADTLILTLVGTQSEVGIYGAAYRVLDILLMLPVLMMGVVLPILTTAWTAKNLQRFTRGIQKTFNVFIMLILPILAGAIMFATPVMVFIAGSAFAPSGPILTILLLAFTAATISTLFGHTTVAINHQKKVIWIYAVDAVLSVIGYIIFIPQYGMVGAAWVTVFSELFAAVVLAWYIIHHTKVRIQLSILTKTILASGIMFCVLWLLPSWHVLVMIAIGIIVYTLALFATGALSRSEVKQLLSR